MAGTPHIYSSALGIVIGSGRIGKHSSQFFSDLISFVFSHSRLPCCAQEDLAVEDH